MTVLGDLFAAGPRWRRYLVTAVVASVFAGALAYAFGAAGWYVKAVLYGPMWALYFTWLTAQERERARAAIGAETVDDVRRLAREMGRGRLPDDPRLVSLVPAMAAYRRPRFGRSLKIFACLMVPLAVSLGVVLILLGEVRLGAVAIVVWVTAALFGTLLDRRRLVRYAQAEQAFHVLEPAP